MCQPQNQNGAELDAASQLATANNRFGFRLFGEIAQKQPEVNLCISPTSLAQALQMVYNGAGGQTRTGMADALAIQGMRLEAVNQDSRALLDSLTGAPARTVGKPQPALASLPAPVKPQLAIANSLWIANPRDILPAFVQHMQTYYNASVGSLQGAPQNINAWVSQHTQSKITKIVTARDVQHAKAVLVNAVYFKGTWSVPFKPDKTTDALFHLAGGTTKTCKMMSQNGRFAYSEGDHFQIARLPYQGNHLDMVIVLPKPGTTLNTLTTQLTPETWKTWTSKLVSTPGLVELPRFRAEYGDTMNEALASLGMSDAFIAGQADFSLMSHTPLFISKVVHKTFIDVNEQGTEAAAATAVIMSRSLMVALPPFHMTMDRPFLYAIQDRKTGAILFLGTLHTP